MIPYWHLTQFSLGGIIIQTWGFFVALGMLTAFLLASRAVRRAGFRAALIWDIGFWIVLAGFVGARLAHVFFYDWDFFQNNPAEIVRVWHGGFSSFGGFLGAAITGAILVRRVPYNRWRFADAVMQGVPAGWVIGRIGCFLIHDHPGTLTHFLLGVKYPDGIRHDLGLYDALIALAIAAVVLVGRKKLEKYPGMTVSVVLTGYGMFRFGVDFLRAFDARYLGLTPAQYGSMLMFVIGLVLFVKKRKLSITSY